MSRDRRWLELDRRRLLAQVERERYPSVPELERERQRPTPPPRPVERSKR